MKILHVTDTFLPRLGGIELHVADLAARQVRAGHDVLVLTAERQAPTDSSAEVRVERLTVGRTGLAISARLAPVVASFAPDVIHAHLSVGSPFAWAVLRNTAGIPIVGTVHSLLPDAPAMLRTAMRVIGLPTQRITFTAVSDAAAAPVRAALGPSRTVSVLHNGIDPADWSVPYRTSGRFHIVSVGRLAARKRPLVLVDALAGLASTVPGLDWSATVVGDGAQRAKVIAAIQARGLEDRVEVVGALPREAIRELLGSADVMVAPATLESFGIAALEARCAGVPIVAMASGGVGEFVRHGVDGLLATSEGDLATCLSRLATDPGLAQQIRRHNTAVPVPMTWDAVLRSHDQVYAEAVRHPVTARFRHRAGRPAFVGAPR